MLYIGTWTVYDFGFRLLNNPALDKDFALLYVLPGLLFLTLRFLNSRQSVYFWLLVLSTPMVLYFHPFTAVYYLISVTVLLIGLWKLGRAALLTGGLSVSWFVLLFWMGSAQGFHDAIETMIRYSLEWTDGALLYWSGHYATVQGTDMSNTMTWWHG